MNKNYIKTLKIILVNSITLIRLIGAFSLPFIYFYSDIYIASIFIILLFISDFLDGLLARKLNVCTFFGSIMDAFSDKLLSIVSFVLLGIKYNVMLLPIVIELLIFMTSCNTYKYGGNLKTSYIGKVKTFILDLSVIISFLLIGLNNFNLDNNIINTLISNTSLIISILALITTLAGIITLIDYIFKNIYSRKNPKYIKIKNENKKFKDSKTIIRLLFDTDYFIKNRNESIMKLLRIE